MVWKVTALIAFTTLLAFPITSRAEGKEDKLYLVDVRGRSEISGVPSNLSPALIATKDADGELMGSDGTGKPVIAVASKNTMKLVDSRAVIAINPAPQDWTAVKHLKLSYKEKLDANDLNQLGLNLIEDYERGSFMIVEPKARRIDGKLAAQLERNKKIGYAVPVFRIKPIP